MFVSSSSPLSGKGFGDRPIGRSRRALNHWCIDRASLSPIASFVRARLDEGVGAKVAWRRFLRLIWAPSSPDKNVCSPKQITWVNTQKNKLKVKAFSLAYDFLMWLVLPGSGALLG